MNASRADRFLSSEHVTALAGPTSGRNSQVVIGLDSRRIRTGGMAVFSTPELIHIETRLLRWARSDVAASVGANAQAVDRVLGQRPELSSEQTAMVRGVCSSSLAIQPVIGRPGSGKTHATAACIEAVVVSGIPVAGCAVSATAAAELEAAAGFGRLAGRPAQTVASLLIDLEQRGNSFRRGTILLIDEASMLGTRDLARLATHVGRAGGAIKLIGDPDQHTSVDTGGVFKALAAGGGPDLVRLTENRRQLDTQERKAIEEYRRGQIADALSRDDDAGKVVRRPDAAATYDALVDDWLRDRQTGSNAPMLAGTNSARRALNVRARALLKAEGALFGDALVVHRREFMVGDEVVARRNDGRLRPPGHAEFVKNGSVGRVLRVDPGRVEIEVEFPREGVVTIPSSYLLAGHIEHAYARTTYGVQGATLDRAHYHPSDVSRFEEGYVAITRATDSTQLYLVEGDIDFDDEADHLAVEPPETGLQTIAKALGRRSDQHLAVEIDPRAAVANRLAQTSTLRQLDDRRHQLDAVLDNRPPSVAVQLAETRAIATSLQERRDSLGEHRPDRKVSRRDLARTLASLEESIKHVDHLVTGLEHQQAKDDAFTVEHGGEFAEREIVRRAFSARRLKLRLEAVVDPPAAVVEVLGPRPTAQRERLHWDRGVESIAVHLDEVARHVPDHAVTLAEILGPRPDDLLARFDHDRVSKAARFVLERDRDFGRSLGSA